MREYVLYSRTGQTNGHFTNLHDAGRLDVIYECIIASIFQSHSIRKDIIFHAILNGRPNPPLHLIVDGGTLYDVRTDQGTWTSIFKNVLEKKLHPGMKVEKISYEAFIKAKAKESAIYVLEERGKSIDEIEIEGNSLFVLGDYIGLPKVTENFTLRYGQKISLGKRQYLAAQCITILNYLQDKEEST
jgi:tRNA (pseudouridine54-N1)-methyltransferase